DPVRDAAHMFAYVAGRVGLDAMAAEQARVAAVLFAAEYFDHVPGAWRRRFGLHCAGALVEVASAIFRRQEAHWPRKVAAAVAADSTTSRSASSAWRRLPSTSRARETRTGSSRM